jgi:predicted metal-dependent hydrolase
VSHKQKKILALIEPFEGQELDPRYLGYFACFNDGRFFEAHEVLEDLWLGDRHGPDGAFYKGLIQLAGAFVHLQKQRPSPAAALFRLTLGNLGKYPTVHQRLNLEGLKSAIERLLEDLDEGKTLSANVAPGLNLEK